MISFISICICVLLCLYCKRSGETSRCYTNYCIHLIVVEREKKGGGGERKTRRTADVVTDEVASNKELRGSSAKL